MFVECMNKGIVGSVVGFFQHVSHHALDHTNSNLFLILCKTDYDEH